MYLNSIPQQTVWNTIGQTIRKLTIIRTHASKQTKNNEKILKITARFKNLSHVFQTLTNIKYIEITYVKVTCLNNALHLTIYEKT
jgi:hypothetical protein